MAEYGTSIAGQLLMQGLTNAGNSYQQGMQNYVQNKQKDALLTGQIEPYLQGLNSQRDNLSDASGSALDKMMNGTATLKDKMLLYGDISSQRDKLQAQQQAQLTQQQIQQGSLQNNMMQAKFNAMQAYANGGMGGQPQPGAQPAQPSQLPGAGATPIQQPQPQGAAAQPQGSQPAPGGGASSVTIPAPTPISIDDPYIRSLYPQALAASGYDPEKATTVLQNAADAKNKQNAANYDNLTKTVKATGRLVYSQPHYDPNTGLHDFDNYYNEQIVGAGTAAQSYTQGNQLIQYKAGAKPQVPVVTAPGQNAPVGQNAGNDFAPELDSSVTPYNTTAPGWIADNKQAQIDMASSAQRVANSRLLVAAAQAYASGNSSQVNVLRGRPEFQGLQQIFTGANPAAGLKTALSMNTGGVMNSLRAPSGGTTGSRTTAAEFEEADKQLADPSMDMPTILASAQNVNAINERAYAIDSAKASYRKIMPEDKATELAVSQFGAPPQLKAGESGATTSSQTAMATVSYKGKVVQIPVTNLQAAQARGAVLVQ